MTVQIPDLAYAWRPFASREMIMKPVRDKQARDCIFAIDPRTQRWAVVEGAALAILQLADGRRRYSEIIRSVIATADGHAAGDAAGDANWDATQVATELVEAGLLHNGQAEHRAAGVEVYNACDPIGMHIEITNACNMTCTHCYVASGAKLPNEMTDEEIYRAIDMLPAFSGKRIAISGGEPIVRRGCMDIVQYAALTAGLDVDLYTNGRKFPERFALRIADVNRQGRGQVRLQLSLEGATAVTHDLVRGAGAFDDAMGSLTMFRRLGLGPSTVLFVCLTKANIGDVDDLIKLAEDNDAGMLVFSQWQRQGNAAGTPWASIAPSTAEWVAAGEKIMAYKNPKLRVHGNFYGDLSNGGPLCLDGALFPKHIYYYNAFPRITPQGDILADQLWVDPDWFLGNVRAGDTLESCFQSAKFHDQLNLMRARTHAIEECSACEWKNLCEGGSAGHTYAEYGHMREKDLFCESRKYWFNRYVEHQMARL